jgi:hypothetical protein
MHQRRSKERGVVRRTSILRTGIDVLEHAFSTSRQLVEFAALHSASR